MARNLLQNICLFFTMALILRGVYLYSSNECEYFYRLCGKLMWWRRSVSLSLFNINTSYFLFHQLQPALLSVSSWTSCSQSAWWPRRFYSSRTSPPEWSPVCPWRAAQKTDRNHSLFPRRELGGDVLGVGKSLLRRWGSAPRRRWCPPPWSPPGSRSGSRRGWWSPAAGLQHIHQIQQSGSKQQGAPPLYC